jgi:hypothetical protein
MNDTRLDQACALIDDARTLIADLQEDGGHGPVTSYQLASAREGINQAITYLNRLREKTIGCEVCEGTGVVWRTSLTNGSADWSEREAVACPACTEVARA